MILEKMERIGEKLRHLVWDSAGVEVERGIEFYYWSSHLIRRTVRELMKGEKIAPVFSCNDVYLVAGGAASSTVTVKLEILLKDLEDGEVVQIKWVGAAKDQEGKLVDAALDSAIKQWMIQQFGICPPPGLSQHRQIQKAKDEPVKTVKKSTRNQLSKIARLGGDAEAAAEWTREEAENWITQHTQE